MYVAAYAPGDTPVVIDRDGRTLGGREWGPVLTTEEEAKSAFADGRLIKVAAEDLDAANPDARAAIEAAAELEETRKKAEPVEVAKAAEKADATPTRSARRAQEKAEESE